MPPRTKPRRLDVIERIDRVSEAMARHRRIWPFTVPIEVELETYKAVVQLFAEGLADGSLTYAGKLLPAHQNDEEGRAHG